MRQLVEALEELLCESDSPITHKHENHQYTDHTHYNSLSKFEPSSYYHKDYSGVTHEVNWKTKKPPSDANTNMSTLSDAGRLHKHFISNVAKAGDIIKNYPSNDTKPGARERIYKRYGFGKAGKTNSQFGIVVRHPETGEHKLQPIEHHEIKSHKEIHSTKDNISDNAKVLRVLNPEKISKDHYPPKLMKIGNSIATVNDNENIKDITHHFNSNADSEETHKLQQSHSKELAKHININHPHIIQNYNNVKHVYQKRNALPFENNYEH